MTDAKRPGSASIILAMAVSPAFESTPCAATIELDCGQPANLHRSVDLGQGMVLSPDKK